jgi:N-acetylglutamate synthase-like GNAT family acetyltransferase
MSIIIREACLSDSAAIADLMGQLGYPTTAEIMSDRIKLYQQDRLHKALVAELEGVVIGCVALAISERFHRVGRTMRIMGLIVDAEHRRQGAGKLLMESAEKFAQENNCDVIELTSGMHRDALGSHDFYKRLGYTELNDIKKYMAKKLPANK